MEQNVGGCIPSYGGMVDYMAADSWKEHWLYCQFHEEEAWQYFLPADMKFVCADCVLENGLQISKDNAVKVKNKDILKHTEMIE